MSAPTASGVSAPSLQLGGTATSLTIHALPPGDPWELVLTDRALPYRADKGGSLKFSGKMNVQTTYYPGNPVATQQVVGSEEGSTSLNGVWKDRFVAQGNAAGGAQPLLLNGSPIYSVADAVAAVDAHRRLGRQVRVTWGGVIRVGLMVAFEVNWLRQTDVEWSMEFAWASQGEDPGPAASPSVIHRANMLGGMASEATARAGDVANAARNLSVVNPNLTNSQPVNALQAAQQDVADLQVLASAAIFAASDFVQAVNGHIQNAYSAASAMESLADNTQQVVYGSADAVRKAAAIWAYVVGENLAVEQEIDARPSVYFYNVELPPPAPPGPVALPIAAVTAGQMLYAEAAARRLRKTARDARYEAARQRSAASAAAAPSGMLAVFVARQGDDLRRICTQLYGNPNSWVDLATFNGLSGSGLGAGQLVFVPTPLPAATAFGIPKRPTGTAMVGA